MTTDDTRTGDGVPADADAMIGMERRRRRAFTASLAVVAVVVAIALGFSFFRDPGPEPPIPPKITGTENGGVKRAILHYLGAVASRDPDTVVELTDDDTVRGRALAQILVDDYGAVAATKATVDVVDTESVGAEKVKSATVHWSDGRTQEVVLVQWPGDKDWAVSPQTDRALPENPPEPVDPNSPPSASVDPAELSE